MTTRKRRKTNASRSQTHAALTEKGRILPRRITGMTAKMHRKLTTEIKRARNVLLVK
jgi:ribosomal protein S18